MPLPGDETAWNLGSSDTGGGTDTSYRFGVDYNGGGSDNLRFTMDNVVITDGTIPASPATGACQVPGGAGGGTCALLTATQCTIQGGTYDGDGTACSAAASNIPGDCNQDGTLDLSDVIHLLGFLFQGSPASLPCSTQAANLALMDCNQDGGLDLSDAVYKLAFLFSGGPPSVQGQGCMAIADCPQNAGCP